MAKITPQQQAIIANDIDRIVANAVNPPKPPEESKHVTLPKMQVKSSNHFSGIDDVILELSAYINETDSSKMDMLKTIVATGHGVGFLVGTILSKLATNKNLTREDILDIAHHVILLLCIHDNNEEK